MVNVTINSYRDLIVWKDGIALTLSIYKLTADFPVHERYGLTSQLRRCAVSIPSNIAEGHARLSSREYLHHISIALGSLAELETQVHLATELHYLQKPSSTDLLARTDRLGRQLRALIKSMRTRIRDINSPQPPAPSPF